MKSNVVLVVHGGAGTILRENLTPALEAACHAGLSCALQAGYAVWQAGGEALDIVEAAVRVLEDDPHFNAGRGSVVAHNGRVEMDAAIMRGSDRAAGAVTGLTTVRNPITLARAILENSPFVFLSGTGAEEFAQSQGLPTEDPSYFLTDERVRQLETQRASGAVSLSEDNKFGTVGAVACDKHQHLAAATSTGGMTNKRYGRIGDSPVIGAGTWADDATCAVSATGHGEFFLRNVVAHEIASRMRYTHEPLEQAAHAVIFGPLRSMGGAGGLIALDASGNAALTFNTPGMYRGVVLADGTIETAIYTDGL